MTGDKESKITHTHAIVFYILWIYLSLHLHLLSFQFQFKILVMTNWVTAKGNNNNQRTTKEEQKKRERGVEETAPEEALSAVSRSNVMAQSKVQFSFAFCSRDIYFYHWGLIWYKFRIVLSSSSSSPSSSTATYSIRLIFLAHLIETEMLQSVQSRNEMPPQPPARKLSGNVSPD